MILIFAEKFVKKLIQDSEEKFIKDLDILIFGSAGKVIDYDLKEICADPDNLSLPKEYFNKKFFS